MFENQCSCAFIGLSTIDTAVNALLKLDVPQTIQPDLHAEAQQEIRHLCEALATGLSERLRPAPSMDEILHQLGELVLGSVPTMVLFILLVAAYGVLVRKPLERVLAERRARTLGAVEQARGAMAKAEAETSGYEEKLRNAKLEIFQARELKLKRWNEEREAALVMVRESAQQRIRGARQEIEQSAAEARQKIDSVSGELSSMILDAVLPGARVATEVVQ